MPVATPIQPLPPPMSSPYDSGNGGMVSKQTLLGQQSMRESDVHTYIRLHYHKHLLWAYPFSHHLSALSR